MERGEILWEPTGAPTRLSQFMDATGHDAWPDLLAWSLTDLDGFWSAVAAELDVRWRTPPDGGAALTDRSMPGTVWFPGGELNYAEHALRHADVEPGGIAVIAR